MDQTEKNGHWICNHAEQSLLWELGIGKHNHALQSGQDIFQSGLPKQMRLKVRPYGKEGNQINLQFGWVQNTGYINNPWILLFWLLGWDPLGDSFKRSFTLKKKETREEKKEEEGEAGVPAK